MSRRSRHWSSIRTPSRRRCMSATTRLKYAVTIHVSSTPRCSTRSSGSDYAQEHIGIAADRRIIWGPRRTSFSARTRLISGLPRRRGFNSGILSKEHIDENTTPSGDYITGIQCGASATHENKLLTIISESNVFRRESHNFMDYNLLLIVVRGGDG